MCVLIRLSRASTFWHLHAGRWHVTGAGLTRSRLRRQGENPPPESRERRGRPVVMRLSAGNSGRQRAVNTRQIGSSVVTHHCGQNRRYLLCVWSCDPAHSNSHHPLHAEWHAGIRSHLRSSSVLNPSQKKILNILLAFIDRGKLVWDFSSPLCTLDLPLWCSALLCFLSSSLV